MGLLEVLTECGGQVVPAGDVRALAQQLDRLRFDRVRVR